VDICGSISLSELSVPLFFGVEATMTEAAATLTFLVLVAGCAPAVGPTTDPSTTQSGSGQLDLQSMVGQRVTLTGVYGWAKNGDTWVRLNTNEAVSFDRSDLSLQLTSGQRIKVTGILHFDPASHTNPQWGRDEYFPSHYFFEPAEISAVPAAGAATQP